MKKNSTPRADIRAFTLRSVPSTPVPPPATLLDAFLRKPSGAPLSPAATAAASPPPAARRHWSSADRAELAGLVEAGWTNAQLAQHFNITAAALANTLFRFGLCRRKYRRREPA